MLRILADLLFPSKCVLCGKLLERNETDLCRGCRTDAPECGIGRRKLQFLDSYVAIWYYEEPARSSILRYKFSRARYYASAYGRLLAMKINEAYPDGFDALTWVPTGRKRKHVRGYDQVELLAEAVGAELGVKSVKLLKKIRDNPPQSGIVGDAQRRANVLGVYAVAEDADVEGKRIMLLDDVITTGATAGEAARVLLTAGAEKVYCGAVAAARHNGK